MGCNQNCPDDSFPVPCGTCDQKWKNNKSEQGPPFDDSTRCAVCGEEMTLDMCAYWGVGPHNKNGHIGCFEKRIEVYRVEAKGMGTFYYDDNPPQLVDLMDGCSVGDGYVITVEEMIAGKFHSLPEFTGF